MHYSVYLFSYFFFEKKAEGGREMVLASHTRHYIPLLLLLLPAYCILQPIQTNLFNRTATASILLVYNHNEKRSFRALRFFSMNNLNFNRLFASDAFSVPLPLSAQCSPDYYILSIYWELACVEKPTSGLAPCLPALVLSKSTIILRLFRNNNLINSEVVRVIRLYGKRIYYRR